MRLREIMSEGVETAKSTETADTVWARMRQLRVHHLVVIEGAEIVGVVSDRDLGSPKAAPMQPGLTVADNMSPPVVTARPDTTLRETANRLRGRSVGCLPVVDEGKLIGIVTVTDMLELLGRGAERPSPRSQRA